MSILEVNIRGLRSNIGELSNLCHKLKPAVVVVIETFLDDSVKDGADCITIPGYSLCCRRDRLNTTGGGIAVYCLEGIAIYHNSDQDPAEFELMWFTIALKTQKLLCAAVYRPPCANSDVINYLDSATLPKLAEYSAQSVILLGDFNVHHEDWLGSHNTDTAGRRALEMANSLGLAQIVKEPTREDQILDLVLTDLAASTSTFAAIGTSDHNPVLVKLDIPVSRDKPYRRKVWRYDKADYWGMRGHLSSVDWNQALLTDPDTACSNFTDIVCEAMDIYIPSKEVLRKTGDKAWFDDDCRKKANRKRRLYKKMRQDDCETNRNRFKKARMEYNKAEKKAKKQHDIKIKKELSDGSLSSKEWWSKVNTMSGNKTKADVPVLKNEDQVLTTAKEKAEIFCQTFAKKCHLDDACDPAPDSHNNSHHSIDKIAFRPKDVRRILKKLNVDKANGPDEIPTRVLRECSAELARPLSCLFKLCFMQGVFPQQWKSASVIPIHKRNSKSDPTMYRPISLLSNISKVMETIVQMQLLSYLLKNNLLSDRQFGFRPHHSTADVLTILSQHWSNALDRGSEVCVIAMDIKGAFDKVWHKGLLSKLSGKGVKGKLLTWFEGYLNDRSIKVVLSGQSSTTASINASVPQGSVLGPLLFSVFIDDLEDCCDNPLFLFADDSTLFSEIKSPSQVDAVCGSLNRDLENVKMWADKWKVTFEPSKCKTLIISRKRNPAKLDLYFGNTKLTGVDDLEILGVNIDNKLTWKKHISNVSSRAGQRLGALRRIAPKLDVCGRATVYKAQIRSVMEYASLCWMSASTTSLQLLDRIQKKALRIIGIESDEECANFNIPSLSHRRQVAAAVVMYKMHTSKCPVDLKRLLPPPYQIRRMTRSSLSMPSHALEELKSRTHSTGRSFTHAAVTIWNSLPENIVGVISDSGAQSFKSRTHKYLLQNR